jgi:hypothetical protein
MKNAVIVILILVACQPVFGSGFDNAVLERFDYDGLSSGLSFEPSRLCRAGYGAAVMHTDPHGIDDLSWDYAAARYGRGEFGGYAAVRSYRLKNLYNDVTITAGLAARIYRGIYSSISLSSQNEEFNEAENFNRASASFRVSYDGVDFVSQAGLDEIVIKKPYDIPGDWRPEPIFRATYFVSDDIAISAGYRRDTLGRGRWRFGQEAILAGGLGIRLGYLNNPNTLEWGLDLSYKSIRFMFDYLAANKLSDTVILGISIGN